MATVGIRASFSVPRLGLDGVLGQRSLHRAVRARDRHRAPVLRYQRRVGLVEAHEVFEIKASAADSGGLEEMWVVFDQSGRILVDHDLGVGEDELDPCVRLARQSDDVDDRVDRARVGKHLGIERDRLMDLQLALERTRLQDDTDALAEPAAPVAGIVPQHRHLAPVAMAMTLQDLERGGLSGPVGTEEREHLALLDRETHPVHGAVLTVAFLEMLDHDRGIGHGSHGSDRRPPSEASGGHGCVASGP